MSTLAIRGLRKSFGTVDALRGIDLDVPGKELLAVLGPSGCGKTTLLRIIAGFEHADVGTITIEGDPLDGPPHRRRIGIVPQEGALFPHLDVAGNVGFGVPGDRRRRRVEEMLTLVGLSGYERRKPHELSGGQQQRVALARALAPGPRVVLLDEPFTALDASLRAGVRSHVVELLRATGTTAVLVTHDQTEALEMADTVAVMREGTIVQAGRPEEIYARPADLETAQFVGDAVLVAGTSDGRHAATILGEIAVDGGPLGDVTLVLRPEQILRDDDSPIRGFVRSTAFHGHDALVSIDLDTLRVIARWTTSALPQPGDSVGLRVKGIAMSYPTEAGVPT